MRDELERCVNDVLDRIEHATVATVSIDGIPWNTPVYFARRGLSLYWTSRRDAQHSANIRHNGRAFIVVFDSSHADSSGAAVYIETHVTELTDDHDIEGALQLIYRRRDKPVPAVSELSAASHHAVYHAKAIRVWSNVLHTSGDIPWDERVEITSL
jgi:nitroimidazol reductase NimA-like FMN-containing flavoprotein (pyridoxamine 5'-phosphate oxidase superfamily)